jgi:capping protein alpha
MGDVTEEELVQIATNFLLNSPPGEFMDVVTDVRALIPNEQLLNNHAAETFRDYNTEQMIQVVSPAASKHQVLITKHGEVGDSEYLDPRGNKVIAFDHIRQEVTSSRAIGNELDSDVEPYRAAFDDEAVKYANEHYTNGATTVYGKKKGNQYQVIVCISSSKFNPSNYWNGRWRSTWTITFSPSGGQATVDGKLQVNVHYYEEGNVQLNNTVEKHLTAQAGDPSATAANALKAIIKAEQAFHSALDASYTTMGDTTFKALRRALPITRMKIDWNKIRTYKIGSELK